MPATPAIGIPIARAVHVMERMRTRLERLIQKMVPPHFALLYVISGARDAQAVCTAAQLGIADVLEDGPRTVDDIAARVGANPDAVARLLRFLSSRAIFSRHKDGRYGLTPMADALRTGSPVSMRAMAMLTASAEHWEHWGHLADAIRTGEPIVPKLRGMSLFEHLETNPELGAVFNDAMTSVSNLAIPPTLKVYDFTRFTTVVDVGGGHGAFLAAILQQARHARGILFDVASVTAGAEPKLRAAGVADRCSIESGSFFDEVPAGADAYVLKAVIHDWAEEDALRILGKVRDAIAPDGTLLLVELVLPADGSPHPGRLLDLDMLLTNGGRERTADEYRDLLRRAGFRMTRTVPTVSPMTLVEAVPA